ncbi:hypothetical protein PAAG_12581 [Paracoccidioides lutzii Pb01]|uniref:ribonuclease Z n=1 Tax=Paracoccidioides lutzii (strain ATCC MYA-826 / Pb01) TaxID=502779 RepID=A0A0A2V316_PARBA|nr:hypothetical protein PAAG_12581 [Paracoccidioides lutzii Pb01]KGQ00752.1 hypothetical protein PAAG_12581 [Paracoccidioides lutzii Pb01]
MAMLGKYSTKAGKLASLCAAGTLLTNAIRRSSLNQVSPHHTLHPLKLPSPFFILLRPSQCNTLSGIRTTPNQLPFRTSHFKRDVNLDQPLFLAPALDTKISGGIHRNRYLFRNLENVSRYPHDSYELSPIGCHPMKFYFEFITTPTADTPGTTILLHFDDKRYLFGHVPEGLQRACSHRGVKLTHVTDIFMSGKTSWTNNGGLLGVILTVAESTSTSAWSQAEDYKTRVDRLEKLAAEAEDPVQAQWYRERLELNLKKNKRLAQDFEKGKLAIHGGPNLTHAVATARKFIFRTGMPVFIHEFNEFMGLSGNGEVETKKAVADPTWSDSHLNIWALSISPSSLPESPTSSAGNTKSSRKRNLDEFQGGAAGAEEISESEDGILSRAQDQITRQAVVSDMFNSDWRLDSLVEMPLSEVRMPARIFVRNSENHKIESYTGPKPGETEELPDLNVLVRRPWPGAMIQSLPPTTPSDISISYIIQHHDVRGKFNAEKAIALGVPRGPKFSKLTMGHSVESTDGKEITPEMVLGEPQPGGGIALMDLPTADYVENLLNRPEWTTPEVMRGFTTFIWVLGPGVGGHPLIQKFVSKMSHYKHIVSSPDFCPNYLAFPHSSMETSQFSVLDSARYSVPHHDNVILPQKTFLTSSALPTPAVDALKSAFEPAVPGLQLELQPKFVIKRDNVQKPLNADVIKNDIPPWVIETAHQAEQEIEGHEFQQILAGVRRNLPDQDAEIITLGTGSSVPSKYRSVSGTLLTVPGVGNYLFDCGENTLGQLQRVFSPQELRKVLQDMKVVWISHLHADHHLGTVSVIRAWYNVVYGTLSSAPSPSPEQDLTKILSEKRLFVVSHAKMIEWLAEYAGVENFGFDKITPLEVDSSAADSFRFSHLDQNSLPILNERGNPMKTLLSFNPDQCPFAAQLQAATGLSTLLTTPVMHCNGSKATSFVFPSGLKVSYSGDCRPSRNFAKIGKDSTVLIHEATFEDDMYQDARAKRHSTSGEALQIAKLMRAKNIVLTHFSQRYTHKPTIPRLQIWASSSGSSSGSRSPRSCSNSPSRPTSPGAAMKRNSWRGYNTPDVTISRNDYDNDDYEPETSVRAPRAPNVMQLGDVPVPVVVAFDLMRLRIGDVFCAQRYVPVLNRYYKYKEAVELSNKGVNQKRSSSGAGAGGKGKRNDQGKRDIKGKKDWRGGKGGKRDDQRGRLRDSGPGPNPGSGSGYASSYGYFGGHAGGQKAAGGIGGQDFLNHV